MANRHGSRFWEIEHFVGYFAFTRCFAWPQPFVVAGALMAVALLLEGLQAFTPDRSSNVLAALYGAGGVLTAALLSELFIGVRRRRRVMGYKGSLLSFANKLASVGFFFNPKLPTYYEGNWIWLHRTSWNSLFSREESHTARAIKSNLRAGDTFWDVGANIGWFSLLASRIVGPKGRIFSFEPSPDVFKLLSANTRGVHTIRSIQCGVGNADAVAAFAAQGVSSASSFVEEVTKINERYLQGIPIRKVEVNIRKMDTLVKELGRPHLVKIDVEGFEVEVLKGGSQLLSTARPALIIEIHPPQLNLSGGTEALLFQLLSEYGYGWESIHRNPNSLYSIIAKPA